MILKDLDGTRFIKNTAKIYSEATFSSVFR